MTRNDKTMATSKPDRILIAADGSRAAQAALANNFEPIVEAARSALATRWPNPKQ